MAKWSEITGFLDSEFVTRKEYDRLKKELEDLQATVNCDYYEAYLREKKRREALEADLMCQKEPYQTKVDEKQVRDVAGWEYYGD
jgi:hypothetical protein